MFRFIFLAITLASLLPPCSALASIDLPWSTTYNCADWNTYNDALSCNGLSKSGAWNTTDGKYEQITSAANFPGGAGGKGQRHWIAPGTNNNSGGTVVAFKTPQTHVWIRWYMRWQTGFNGAWDSYKAIYLRNNSAPGYIQPSTGYARMFGGGTLDEAHQQCTNCYWRTIYPTGTSDGTWHENQVEIDTKNGVGRWWLDGKLIIDYTGYSWNTLTALTEIELGDNCKNVTNSSTMYIDYDDIAISNTGYIGSISGGGTGGGTVPDTIAPTVSITSPSQNQTLSGNKTLTASASDNTGVGQVQFLLDGGNFGSADTSVPYQVNLDTTTLVNGSHTVVAKAADAAGNNATSSVVTFIANNTAGSGTGGGTVPDTIAPTVSITSPSQNQTLSGNVTLTASASDNTGVGQVQYLLDGANFGSADTSVPYQVNLDTTTLVNGSHTVKAKAADAAGNNATSSVVTFIVNNASGSGTGGGTPGSGGSGTVLMSESFDNANFSARGWYDNTNLKVSNVEHIPGSSSSLEFTFNQGGTQPTTGGATRLQFQESDQVYLSYHVKYSSNWQGSNKSYHPHEFYLLTNLAPQYSNLASTDLTVYVEQNEGKPLIVMQDSVNIDTTKINVDLTSATENRAVGGCNGDSDGYGVGDCYSVGGGSYQNGKQWSAGSVYFKDTAGPFYKNDWHFIEAVIKLNTITNGKANKDGIIQYWYDGQIVMNHTNVVFRTGKNPAMRFNQLVLGPYIGDGSPITQTFWLDDLKLSTSKGDGSSTVPTTVSPPADFKPQAN